MLGDQTIPNSPPLTKKEEEEEDVKLPPLEQLSLGDNDDSLGLPTQLGQLKVPSIPGRRNASHDLLTLIGVDQESAGPEAEEEEVEFSEVEIQHEVLHTSHEVLHTSQIVVEDKEGDTTAGELLQEPREELEEKGVFSYADLATIERMVGNAGWKVPVEPGQELERLLKAAIELAKTGADVDHEGCQRFYEDSLTNSFTKILTDSAINNWSPEIQGYIFDSTVLLVKLMAVKLDNMPLLRLMSLVFSPASKFHHYNASQPSRTTPPSSQIPGNDIYARPSDFRAPKGWLVDLINHFGAEGGFERLLENFKLSAMKVERLRKETKIEARNDTLTGLVATLKLILNRSPSDKKKLLQGVEILHLQLILSLIKGGSFNGKMNALNELNRIISPYLFQRFSPPFRIRLTMGFPHCRFFIQENKLTTEDIDLVWDAQRDKHEAIVKNIHDLLAKLAWVLTPDLLDAIFVR
eukprot:sb/3464449/